MPVVMLHVLVTCRSLVARHPVVRVQRCVPLLAHLRHLMAVMFILHLVLVACPLPEAV